jgi:hypothetical protein
MTEDRGTYRCYEEKNFGPDRLALIGQANKIIGEYEAQGLSLTLRQLYYQFVARDILANTDRSYSKLQSVISEGRMAGLVSWTAIEDRTRNLMGHRTYSSPKALFEESAAGYKRDLWLDQPWRPEVWVEKEALAGVVGQIASKLRVDFFACRGYNSQSEQWEAGRRFAARMQKGQRPIVFHLGDHDPSGIDMTRDNRDRLTTFAGFPVTVVRLALNMNQIEELRPPPNPAKTTDSRYDRYEREYNTRQSWELDALDPKYIMDLIQTNVVRIRDEERWDAALRREVDDKRLIAEKIEELG